MTTAQRSMLNETLRHAPMVLARTVLWVVFGLAFWAVALLPLGFGATVIASDSMAPSIRAGDVVVTRDLDAATEIVGRVVTAQNPAEPGNLLTHRVVADNDDGTYMTRGDANRDPDRMPVAREDIEGRGFFLVPWAGLPAHWLSTGAFVPLGLTVVGLGALAFVARDPRSERRLTAPAIGLGAATAGVFMLAIVGTAAVVAPAALDRSSAAFVATVENTGNTWQAGTWGQDEGESTTPEPAVPTPVEPAVPAPIEPPAPTTVEPALPTPVEPAVPTPIEPTVPSAAGDSAGSVSVETSATSEVETSG